MCSPYLSQLELFRTVRCARVATTLFPNLQHQASCITRPPHTHHHRDSKNLYTLHIGRCVSSGVVLELCSRYPNIVLLLLDAAPEQSRHLPGRMAAWYYPASLPCDVQKRRIRLILRTLDTTLTSLPIKSYQRHASRRSHNEIKPRLLSNSYCRFRLIWDFSERIINFFLKSGQVSKVRSQLRTLDSLSFPLVMQPCPTIALVCKLWTPPAF